MTRRFWSSRWKSSWPILLLNGWRHALPIGISAPPTGRRPATRPSNSTESRLSCGFAGFDLVIVGFEGYIPGHPRQQNLLLCGGPKGSPRGRSFCRFLSVGMENGHTHGDVAIAADT